MNQDKKAYIRYIYNTQNRNISAIARELGIARSTVRRALNKTPKKSKVKKPSKLDAYKETIQKLLQANPHLSNVIILEKIQKLGYQGKKSILGAYLKSLRHKVKESYLNIQTLPAEQAQVDWAYAGQISVGAHQRKLYIFCMILSYSRLFYFEPTVSMSSDIFLACHINAFRFFGGIGQSIVYDNLKSVVLSRLGRKITFNPLMLDFAAYYGFKIKVCNVRSPQEKGKVERAIGYISKNFLQRENYRDFNHIRSQAFLWNKNIAAKRKHGATGKRPIEVFEQEEKALLLPLPEKDYDYAQPKVIHPQKDGLFRFDANRYSVPEDYLHQPLTLKAYQDVIKVFKADRLLCEHKRSYDKYQTIKDLAHYRKRLNRNTRYAHQQMVQNFAALCPEAEAYLKGLQQKQIKVVYHVKQIRQLEVIFGKTALCSAIIKALKIKAFHWESIKRILYYENTMRPQVILTSSQKDELMQLSVDTVDLTRYDALLDETENDDGQ